MHRVVLQEHRNGAVALAGGLAQVRARQVDGDRVRMADLPRHRLGLGQVAPADGDGQFRMQPAQGLRGLGTDDARAADDEHGFC
jgi:hypothetical protein